MKTILALFTCLMVICMHGGSLYADTIGTTGSEVRAIAEPILEGILEGFKNDDYAVYSKNFDATLREAVTERRFHETDAQITSSMGECTGREYLGFLHKGKMTAVLWKATFSRTEDDILIKLVLSKRGDQYLVTGLWLQ